MALWIGVIAAVVLAGGATWWFTRGTASTASTPQSVSRTVAASVQTLRRTISTTGTVTPEFSHAQLADHRPGGRGERSRRRHRVGFVVLVSESIPRCG